MGIIPKYIKTEISKEKDLIDKGFRELETWCRRRVLVLQNEHLAEIAKKSLTSQVTRKLNSIKPEFDETNDVDAEPSWVKHLIAAVKPPPRPHHRAHDGPNQIVAAVQVAAARPAVMDHVIAMLVDILRQAVRKSSIGSTSATNVGLTPTDVRSANPSRT